MMDDGNVTELGVSFKRPADDDKHLSLVPKYGGCTNHSYVIDPESDVVTCRNCDKTFNPMSVLVDLARRESRWMANRNRYKDEMRRLSERSRTKCQHCGQITRISRR